VISNNFIFAILRDGQGQTQVVVNVTDSPDAYQTLKALTLESVVCVEGIVRNRPLNQVIKGRKTGGIEVCPNKCSFYLTL
jgi:aspartyl-tRNA synthetase